MASPEIDLDSGVPLYRQVMEILRAEITQGTLDPAVPMTEAKLIARFGVSAAPIKQALNELTREGFVYRKQRLGTFPVMGVRVDRPADLKTGDLYRFLQDRGLHPTSFVSDIQRIIPPLSVSQRLNSAEGEKLLHFVRVIEADGKPFAENDIYIRSPEDFLPTKEDLKDGGSALTLLERKYGIALDHAEHEAWATTANAEHAQTLGVAEGSPLLVIDTVFYATGGVAVGWRSAIHRPEEFKFHFVTTN
jgi:GntR family transcriptional regulator